MKCKHCGSLRWRSIEMLPIGNDEYICPECATKYYDKCGCGNYKLRELPRCNKCEANIYTNGINSYGTKPVPVFQNGDDKLRGKDLGCRYYGLEMEYSHIDYGKVQGLVPSLYRDKYIYNKSDSSLNYGVEIVTSPMNKKAIGKFLKDMEPAFNYIKRCNNYDENAGIHVHVNKKSIDPIDRYKLHILLNLKMNSKEETFLYYIAQRISEPNGSADHRYYKAGGFSKYDYACQMEFGGDRHVALNTKNKLTFEFRLFKSTAKADIILSYIELIDTMIDFCNKNGLRDITVPNYILYLKNNTKNKIILERIAEYEKEYGSSRRTIQFVTDRDVKGAMKGIHNKEYINLLQYIDVNGDNKSNLAAILEYKEDAVNGKLKTGKEIEEFSSNTLYSKLLKTVKALLVKEIMEAVA